MTDSKELRAHWHRLMAESVSGERPSNWPKEWQERYDRDKAFYMIPSWAGRLSEVPFDAPTN